MANNTRPATGVTTVLSAATRPECHAPSKCRINDYSEAVQRDGDTDRSKQYRRILMFWQSQGVARCVSHRGAVRCPDMAVCHGAGLVEVRDVINPEASGDWFRMAGQGEDTRADVAVFSHMRPAESRGAWCGCNIVPEVGTFNHSRGAVKAPLTPAARALLMAWPDWWTKHAARKASLVRLGL